MQRTPQNPVTPTAAKAPATPTLCHSDRSRSASDGAVEEPAFDFRSCPLHCITTTAAKSQQHPTLSFRPQPKRQQHLHSVIPTAAKAPATPPLCHSDRSRSASDGAVEEPAFAFGFCRVPHFSRFWRKVGDEPLPTKKIHEIHSPVVTPDLALHCDLPHHCYKQRNIQNK